MRLDMDKQEFEFAVLVENVRDAIIEWEEPIPECPLVRMFRANEEAKMTYLKTMVDYFERN